MTIKECFDLVTPEADRQPRARHSALPSHTATVTLSFDLTASTPLPVSARGIADNNNDRRGGIALHDSDRPPDLPHLHETSMYARSNTLHSRTLAPVTAPVTNSSSSPRKKKSRSSRRRYSGKENSSSDVSAFDSPPVENRKSPFWPPVENRKTPFWTKLTPWRSETLSPAENDLAGKTPQSHYQSLTWILTHYQCHA